MRYAIIVAGGQGKRMNNQIPKQFLELDGKPILYYTLRKFLDFDQQMQIILVLPKHLIPEYSNIINYFPKERNIKIVEGGETRFHSTKNGLKAIDQEGIVFIHDGVRPFVSSKVLTTCLNTTIEKGNAIPCIDLKDSIRILSNEQNFAVDRTQYKAIQTPQTFYTATIQQAFEVEYESGFTDEASVFEKAGHAIVLVEGNEENIKITHPIDLALANYLLKQEQN